MARKFVEYIGGGYWIHRDGRYLAFLKASGDGWYGGANEYTVTSAPLHGPYRFKRTAKKKALEQLALIQHENDFPPTTPNHSRLSFGCRYYLGSWWETLDGEIVYEMEGVRYPDCINWDCFSDE